MVTKDILKKFKTNNDKLETALTKKAFSGDVKNLLLSMQYKIVSSYNDYSNIKVNVENKNQFIDNIINIIEGCDSIQIVKASSVEGQSFLNNNITSEVDKYSRTIKVLPTEKAMLYALFKLNETKMYLDEKHNLIRVAFPELLNEGRDINNVEIIRDFNAWSWNTLPSEISNIDCNLIYQNLLILLGFEFLDNWMKQESRKDQLEELEERLKEEYDADDVDNLLELIYRIAIMICVKRNKSEKTRLLDEMEWDKKELERLDDKEKLICELTKTKKEKAKEIEKIDRIINSNELLVNEFDKRNEKLSQYHKIFNIDNLRGTLKKERKKALNEIAECNYLLDAKNYIKRKKELEKNIDLLSEAKNCRNKEKYKINIQKLFLRCIDQKIFRIQTIEQKKELVQLLSILRYYNFIIYDEERVIKDIEALEEQVEDLAEKTIRKLYYFKVLNPITKDVDTDIEIIKPILNTRIMNFENVYIQVVPKGNRIEVSIYDGDILEIGFDIDNFKDINIRQKRKTKLFV